MSAPLTRATATRLLAERLRHEVVVANLGQASFDLHALADRPLNCYTFGAMGQCSSIALGIALARPDVRRSEEHTSELQSLAYLVCRLLLEKKKKHNTETVQTKPRDNT